MINNFAKDTKYRNNPSKTNIYLDYQATTPLDERVFNSMLPYMTTNFGNPHSSEHSFGWIANDAIEDAKEKVATYINALNDEIFFTSGATEANNLAIIGTGYSALDKAKRRKILISSIEHKCVLGSARFLEKLGFNIVKIPVLNTGHIDIEALKFLLTDDVLLVSIMATNNEIGTNQDLAQLSSLIHSRGAIFHVDAAQGAYTNIDVVENNIDMMSLSAHKIYGPKGIGALYINQSSPMKPYPIIYGGGQQEGLRSGTIPTFLAVGMGKAFDLLSSIKNNEKDILKNKRDRLLNGLLAIDENIRINGDMESRHPGNLNVLIPNKDARQFILSLQPDIAFSTGSACTSGIQEPSHVLKAIGLSTEDADKSFRMTVGRFTTDGDLDFVLKKIRSVY